MAEPYQDFLHDRRGDLVERLVDAAQRDRVGHAWATIGSAAASSRSPFRQRRPGRGRRQGRFGHRRLTSRHDRPGFPFWPILFDNVAIRLLGSDDFPTEAKRRAAADLTAAARDGALSMAIGTPLPLKQTAEGHDRVDAGTRSRVLIAVAD